MKETKIVQLYKDCSSVITEKTQEIHQLVMGTGNYDADVLFVGDMPDGDEEAMGIPFIGKAGVPLHYCLQVLGLKKEEVYMTHVVKYRPYRVRPTTNKVVTRSPKKEEIDFFLPYLLEEISIVRPKIIITLGILPLRAIMGDSSLKMDKEHGRVKTKYILDSPYKILPINQIDLMKVREGEEMSDLDVLRKLIEYVGIDKEEERSPLEPIIEPKKSTMNTARPAPSQKANEATMKAIIVYGGDGSPEDPTLVAIDRVSKVLSELHTNIVRLNLYKGNVDIYEFLHELEDAQAVVLATTVEWLGIGGHMQLFLDKCWKYGNKSYFENVYLFGVVISKQHFERDTYNHLIKSWELLGGIEGASICACIKRSLELETNGPFLNAIDKKTEEFYRIAHQKRTNLPTSIRSNKVLIEVPAMRKDLPPENGEEQVKPANLQILDEDYIPNYEVYIEKQQKDIEDLSNLIKGKLTQFESKKKTEPEVFKASFTPKEENLSCKIQWNIENHEEKNLFTHIQGKRLHAKPGTLENADTILFLNKDTLDKILEGKMTIQRAFLTGEIKAKGDFSVIYKLDEAFKF